MSSVRVSAQLEEKVNKVAARKGITRSEVFRRALESYCDQELITPQSSRYDDVIGKADGPVDGSERVTEYFVERLKKKYS